MFTNFISALESLLPLSKRMNVVVNTLPVRPADIHMINVINNTNRSMHRVINRLTNKESENIFIYF